MKRWIVEVSRSPAVRDELELSDKRARLKRAEIVTGTRGPEKPNSCDEPRTGYLILGRVDRICPLLVLPRLT